MTQSSAQQQCEQVLDAWQQWRTKLTQRPSMQATLSAGRSHASFLVATSDMFFAIRIESEHARSLAMKREQEIRLLQELPPLCPELIWSNDRAIVTQFVEGHHWRAPSHLESLTFQLRELHGRQIPLPAFSLLDHVERYWARLTDQAQRRHREQYRVGQSHLALTLARHPEQCLCHNDLIPENILQNGDQFTFIDWEYAGYNSPYFDLATLVEYGALTKSQQRELLRLYWQDDDKLHQTTLRDFQRIVRFIEWLWELLQDTNNVRKRRSLL